MTREEFQVKHPELFQQVLDEGKAAATEANRQAVDTAVKDERERVVALASAGFGGDAGKKFAAAAEKGLSAQDISDLGISFASPAASDTSVDEESRKQILDGLKGGGQQPVGKLAGEDNEDFEAKVKAYREKHDCGRGTAVSAIAKAHPDLHKAWLEQKNQ